MLEFSDNQWHAPKALTPLPGPVTSDSSQPHLQPCSNEHLLKGFDQELSVLSFMTINLKGDFAIFMPVLYGAWMSKGVTPVQVTLQWPITSS